MTEAEERASFAEMSAAERDDALRFNCEGSAGALGSVPVLIDLGADVNGASRTGQTPLGIACASPDSEPLVEFLLARGAEPNVADEHGDTPLGWAASYGSARNCARLIASGAVVSHGNNEGETALLRAAYSAAHDPRCLEVIPVLLAAGAQAHVTASKGPRSGRTPLELVCETGAREAARQLLDAGARATARVLSAAIRASTKQAAEGLQLVELCLARGAPVTEKHLSLASEGPAELQQALHSAFGAAEGAEAIPAPATGSPRDQVRRAAPRVTVHLNGMDGTLLCGADGSATSWTFSDGTCPACIEAWVKSGRKQ